MRFEFSAGGVVFKKEKDKTFILVGQHSGHHGWVFPKGIIGDKKKYEKKEETAVREVKEETGIEAKIIKPVEPVTFWYVFEKEKVKKTVYYFVMEYIAGDTKDHDWEMEKVEWIPMEKVEETLTFKSDKKVWQEAKGLIE